MLQYQHKLILLISKLTNVVLYLFLLLSFPTIQFLYFIFRHVSRITFFAFLVIFHLYLIFFSKVLYHVLVSLISIYFHHFLILDFINLSHLFYLKIYLSNKQVNCLHQNLSFHQLWTLSCYLLLL